MYGSLGGVSNPEVLLSVGVLSLIVYGLFFETQRLSVGILLIAVVWSCSMGGG